MSANNGDANATKILQLSPATPEFKPAMSFFMKSDEDKKKIVNAAYNVKIDYLNNIQILN